MTKQTNDFARNVALLQEAFALRLASPHSAQGLAQQARALTAHRPAARATVVQSPKGKPSLGLTASPFRAIVGARKPRANLLLVRPQAA